MKRKLYIIEDDPCLRTILTSTFQKSGYEVESHECRDGVVPTEGSVVLSDCEMPGRKDLVNPNNVPVIRMSGNCALNPDLEKPFRFGDAAKLVEEAYKKAA